MANLNKIKIRTIAVLAAIVIGLFYINTTDQSLKQSLLVYFFGALIVLGFLLFRRGKE